MSDLFTVGATVFFDDGRQTRVAKVYKNGNIVLEGSTRQYRPWRDTAHSTGDRWSRSSVRADTPQFRAEAIATKERSASKTILYKEIDRITAIIRKGGDALIEEAKLIKGRTP